MVVKGTTEKLLLIRPKSKGVGVYPPYNLVRLASYFNGETRICDLTRDSLIPAGMLGKDTTYVGITTWGNTFPTVKQLCHHVKSTHPHVRVVVGGAGVTASPDYAMKIIGRKHVDTFVIGDGELFIEHLNPVMATRGFVQPPLFNWKPNRFPRWDLIEFERYLRFPGLPVETSRGCPFNCVWCTAHLINGRRWRPRRVKDVVREIIALYTHFNCRTFYFPDDNATVDPKRWLDLMSAIINCRLNIELHTPEGIQAHHLDRYTLQLMKKAGFRHITIGVESGVQRVLDEVIDKGGLKVEQVENVVRLCGEVGLAVSCFFVVGAPGETLDEIRETVRFAQHLREQGAYSCIVRNAIPVPGTRMFREALARGQLTVPPEQLFDTGYIHRPEHFMITDEWTPRQVMSLVTEAKRQDAQHILAHRKGHVLRQGLRKLTRDPRGALRRVRQLLREASR